MLDVDIKKIKEYFLTQIPKDVFASIRHVSTFSENVMVRNDNLESNETFFDNGAMVTIISGNGCGYSATCDLTKNGIKRAIDSALNWASINASHSLVDWPKIVMPTHSGSYETNILKPWESVTLNDKIDLLKKLCGRMKLNDFIVARNVTLSYKKTNSYYLTSNGNEIFQKYSMIIPDMSVVASKNADTEERTHDSFVLGRQAGLEFFDEVDFTETRAREIAQEAIMLLSAPTCPTGKMDLILCPSQMSLQIHESVGHPLEMDRILGDERNFAGTSFVKPDMIGNYQYGSKLMNITFDPTVSGEYLSYGYDDDGSKAEKVFLIENGILKSVLGGCISQARSGKSGVSNSRASNWHRPPIDRMANLNQEIGKSSFDEMVGSIENGILMKTCKSWSIDDSRNKFQFGCEWGQLIKNGKLGNVVRRSNYSGVSSAFWRSLKMVGDKDTFQIMGLPNCGKGEPNQVVSVGHASPACLFENVDVFGGE